MRQKQWNNSSVVKAKFFWKKTIESGQYFLGTRVLAKIEETAVRLRCCRNIECGLPRGASLYPPLFCTLDRLHNSDSLFCVSGVRCAIESVGQYERIGFFETRSRNTQKCHQSKCDKSAKSALPSFPDRIRSK
jgi:hypothetical protein